MESLVAFVSSSLDAAMPPPAALGQEYYQDTTLELHCFTEDNASFCPVSDIRGRVRPIRRPSTFRGRQPVRQKLDQQSLLAASRIMMRKNQQWLNSKEDLTTLDTADLEPSQGLTDATSSALVEINGMEGKGIDRHTGTLLDTIPDEAPATMTRAPSLAVLDDSSSNVSNATSLVWEPMSNPLLHDLMMDNDVNSLFSNSTAGASTSSGTLTPDNTLSHGSSLETLTTPPPLQHLNSTPSFTIHRGDSVEGVFLSSDVPPPVAEELPISPSDSHQSPFRRQVFTSLMTRQSALVSRINQQSSNLLKTMQEVAEATVGPPSNGSITVQKSSTCESEKHRRTKVIFRGGIDSGEEDDALSFSTAAADVAPLAQAIQVPVVKRVGERMLSICDSGLGWDTDDDLRTSSLGSFSTLSSTSTLSEDSENVPEDEAVLCGSRVSQMTKTYNDIDAVTRLLQEKEKDLELAAKIGQQLLNRNKGLEERNSLLDGEVASATEKITQLKHDLLMKSDLLAIYTNDVDDTSSCETTPTSVRLINMDILQDKVKNLEGENRSLRQEATKLATDTMECEDKEKELVTGVIKQLTDANLQVRQLSEELAKKVEDSLRQQEEITQLLAQVVDLQAHNKRLTCENDELASMVGVARECQQELTMELAELKEKYAEVLDLLHDTQDQLRRAQKKNLPGSRGHHLGSHGLFNSPYHSGNDSIASELHSLNAVGGEEEGNSKASSNMRRTFDTVRLTGRHSHLGSSQGSLNSLGYGGSVQSTPTHLAGGTMSASYLGSRGSSVYSGGSGHPSLDSGADSDASMHTDSEDNYPGSHLGVPGWPGTPDLDSCLRRLGPSQDHRTPPHFLPYGCRTPDSIMSTGSGKSGLSVYGGGNGTDWKLPQKLQIVKPIEGSLTLHQWSRLATPHLGGLLEEREGVAIKGGTGTDLNLEVYSMSDLEEDELEDENPGKQFMSTSGIFTLTNSTILHPDDQVNLTPSIRQSQVSVLPTTTAASHVAATPGTPIRNPSLPPSRRGSTATFSVNTGLAKMLNERGTSKGDNSSFAPTATPANSPTASRPGSPEPEGYKLPGLEDLTKTFYYGASLLRRTFYKSDPSAPQSPTGPQVNLVEQVQAIGVDRFVGLSGSALTVGGVVTSRPATSPLLHLSNLIMSSAKSTSNTVTDSKKPGSTASCTSFASTTLTSSGKSASGMIMSAPKLPSPGERRPTLPSGAPMGIPGHPGAGHLDTRLSQLKPGQRADLGTVGGRPRPTSLGSVPPRGSLAEPNVGTVGWTSFGRKGGLL